MKLVTVLSVLAGSLIVAGQVRAERTSTRLTTEKTSDHLYSFTIKVERLKTIDRGDLVEIHVTVKTKNAGAHIAKPHRSGKLEVFNGKEFISSCDVQPTGREEELSFSFNVAVKYAEKSRFIFAETDPSQAEFGQGFYYWFYLKDFVEPGVGADPEKKDRPIGKEPAYTSKDPRYCQLVFGPEAKQSVWLVIDGEDLYVDRNANGDLTDEGDRVTRKPLLQGGGFEVPELSVGDAKNTYTNLIVYWTPQKRGAPAKEYAVEVMVEVNKRYCQYGVFKASAASPKDAPIIHFGGPLEMILLGRDVHLPAPGKEAEFAAVIGTKSSTGHPAMIRNDRNLSPKADVHPAAEITFPGKATGADPVRVKLPLDQRCCNTRFFTTLRTPAEVGAGKATVVLTFPAWTDVKVSPWTGKLDVVESAPQEPRYAAYWLSKQGGVTGYRILLITRMPLAELPKLMQLEALFKGDSTPQLLERKALTITTYKDKAILNDDGVPIKPLTRFKDLNEKDRLVEVNGVRHRYEECPLADVVRLLNAPEGKERISRIHPPLGGMEQTARALRLLIEEQMKDDEPKSSLKEDAKALVGMWQLASPQDSSVEYVLAVSGERLILAMSANPASPVHTTVDGKYKLVEQDKRRYMEFVDPKVAEAAKVPTRIRYHVAGDRLELEFDSGSLKGKQTLHREKAKK